MCESPAIKGRTGWRGWLELPSRTIQRTDEKWVDLTHPFSTSVPRSAMFPPPKFSYFAQMPERPLNITRMETIVHMGTHVDAPRHFYALQHFPGDFHAVKKVSFPQKKRIRVR